MAVDINWEMHFARNMLYLRRKSRRGHKVVYVVKSLKVNFTTIEQIHGYPK